MTQIHPSEIGAARSDVRILVVDDHPLVRRGLQQLIEDQPGWQVCGEADRMMDALHLARTTQPHLVVVDLSLKDGSGIELIKEIKSQSPEIRMLIVSNHDDSLYAERGLHAGASGYVNKLEAGDRLVDAIRQVLAGRVYLSPQMTDRLLSRALGAGGDPERSPIEKLTDRELEVFELIGRGMTTRQVAQQLHLSPKTIESYRESIKNKLSLRTSTELIRHAVQRVLEGA
jgi:DNA-binding NarL/FixJ family response regulator